MAPRASRGNDCLDSLAAPACEPDLPCSSGTITPNLLRRLCTFDPYIDAWGDTGVSLAVVDEEDMEPLGAAELFDAAQCAQLLTHTTTVKKTHRPPTRSGNFSTSLHHSLCCQF